MGTMRVGRRIAPEMGHYRWVFARRVPPLHRGPNSAVWVIGPFRSHSGSVVRSTYVALH